MTEEGGFTLRLRLAKEGAARFLGHLDLVRVLERALRRAGLPVAYSAGFNPQPRLTAASALALGATSEAEIFEVTFSEPVAPGECLERLGAQLPGGLRLLAVKPVAGRRSLAAALAWASYRLRVAAAGAVDWAGVLSAAKPAWGEPSPVGRVPGEGVRQLSLLAEGEREAVLRAVLRAGSRGHVRPEDLVAALAERSRIGIELLEVHREELFAEQGGVLVPLWEL